MESFNISERVIGFYCEWDVIPNTRGVFAVPLKLEYAK